MKYSHISLVDRRVPSKSNPLKKQRAEGECNQHLLYRLPDLKQNIFTFKKYMCNLILPNVFKLLTLFTNSHGTTVTRLANFIVLINWRYSQGTPHVNILIIITICFFWEIGICRTDCSISLFLDRVLRVFVCTFLLLLLLLVYWYAHSVLPINFYYDLKNVIIHDNRPTYLLHLILLLV